MFKIPAKLPAFVATVTVHTAALKGAFKAEFQALDEDEIKRLEDAGRANGRGYRMLLEHVTLRVLDCERDDGTPATVEHMLKVPGVGAAMVGAYMAGLYEAASGN